MRTATPSQAIQTVIAEVARAIFVSSAGVVVMSLGCHWMFRVKGAAEFMSSKKRVEHRVPRAAPFFGLTSFEVNHQIQLLSSEGWRRAQGKILVFFIVGGLWGEASLMCRLQYVWPVS